ncbi:MAG: methylase involved in ubiquinone/menaquinone biosynthesis [Phycisphaerales bacterium]|nr:methylase involved in ubiquinone/menaquinone biosynthesis [Phycisphaerales bacterium]
MTAPGLDPTPIFDLVRLGFATELLAAAVAHFNLFALLAKRPLTFDDLRNQLGLAHRPATVLLTALRGMGLIVADASGKLTLSPAAHEALAPGGEFYMGDYVALVAENPGVKNIVERLRTNKPVESREGDRGAAFIFREGLESAMDHEASARRLTLALAGRARIVAPALAQNLPLPGARKILDVGGGTGLYSIALLRVNPDLRAVIWDRPEVLKVAKEMAEKHGVADRVDFTPGDMFADPVPAGCDVALLSNVLHDWDIPECQTLLNRCAAGLPQGGKLLIHDVYLNDEMDGPLPLALYSAALFTITEGRAYSAAEYRKMLTAAGLKPGEVIETAVHCGVLAATK